eukprot:11343327-Alexandrium_andersonii.AAC.1
MQNGSRRSNLELRGPSYGLKVVRRSSRGGAFWAVFRANAESGCCLNKQLPKFRSCLNKQLPNSG